MAVYAMDLPREVRKRKSRVGYGLLVLLFLLVLAAGSLVFLLLWKSYFAVKLPLPTCQTDACYTTALRFLDNMDPEVPPCQNFYQFACGNFTKHASIPNGKKKTAVTVEIEFQIIDEVRLLLQNMSVLKELHPKPYRDLLQLHSMCVDQTRLEQRGVSEASTVLQEAGGWPLLNKNSLSINWTFQETETSLKNLSLSADSLLEVSLDTNFSDIRFVVQKPTLLLPGNARSKDSPGARTYLQYMVDIAVLYGADRDQANNSMQTVLDFERSLATLLQSRKDVVFSSNYSLNDLTSLPSMASIKWPELLKTMLPKSFNLTGNYTVLVKDPEYIDKLNEFLKKHEPQKYNNTFPLRADPAAE